VEKFLYHNNLYLLVENKIAVIDKEDNRQKWVSKEEHVRNTDRYRKAKREEMGLCLRKRIRSN
jgi:hypothetical protein